MANNRQLYSVSLCMSVQPVHCHYRFSQNMLRSFRERIAVSYIVILRHRGWFTNVYVNGYSYFFVPFIQKKNKRVIKLWKCVINALQLNTWPNISQCALLLRMEDRLLHPVSFICLVVLLVTLLFFAAWSSCFYLHPKQSTQQAFSCFMEIRWLLPICSCCYNYINALQ